ncbi:DUF4157 domain-containing protein [Flavobacterium pectinovorum]|uniref:DUF4157 domain-containing protein n=1 Tax=Flavobacterium pectinovorum TaxID=29533 RepID=A0A502EWM3_9FLAO|nr:DUF4157 domain-containing protein [Flavobacterium pectinovorum]TPG40836.1 DUF4157 domain-containing protein [Flavobacterium pectinovorum]
MENSYEKAKTQAVANTLNERTVQNKAKELQDNRPASLLQRKVNNTGLPNNLKSGIENLSGHSMDDVKVHYNSDKPAQLNAHAYAQGTDIHIASGQEKHLPHEAWHVIQQKQGRVKPTLQMKGKVNVNDDKGLENEADVMGAKALQTKSKSESAKVSTNNKSVQNNSIAQLLSATNKEGTVLDVVYSDGKVSLTSNEKEIGYVNYTSIGMGVVSQDYIKVESSFGRQGISYLLTYLAASQGGHSIMYLGGGSLSESGALVAKKFGFKNYEPKKDEEGGFWSCFTSCFTSCFGSKKAGASAPLLPKGNTGLLDYAYKTQADQAGGKIPPIKWIEIETLVTQATEKVKQYGWTIS